jgi:hypothetical protein
MAGKKEMMFALARLGCDWRARAEGIDGATAAFVLCGQHGKTTRQQVGCLPGALHAPGLYTLIHECCMRRQVAPPGPLNALIWSDVGLVFTYIPSALHSNLLALSQRHSALPLLCRAHRCAATPGAATCVAIELRFLVLATLPCCCGVMWPVRSLELDSQQVSKQILVTA